EANHDKRREAWIGFYKKDSGRPSITWQDCVDEALCFGWIDGIRKRIDDKRYMNRVTPRTPTSNWSVVNVRRIEELQRLGRVRPSGSAAFRNRKRKPKSGYTYEHRHSIRLDPSFEREFKINDAAWRFFQTEPPGRRQVAIFYVMSAKQETTRRRRLGYLIERCARGEPVGVLTGSTRSKP
ncbi:MAG TPA: YdeI/OmpD-associated family protein, partial [Candidatus Thermoplasmatota archaeon]